MILPSSLLLRTFSQIPGLRSKSGKKTINRHHPKITGLAPAQRIATQLARQLEASETAAAALLNAQDHEDKNEGGQEFAYGDERDYIWGENWDPATNDDRYDNEDPFIEPGSENEEHKEWEARQIAIEELGGSSSTEPESDDGEEHKEWEKRRIAKSLFELAQRIEDEEVGHQKEKVRNEDECHQQEVRRKEEEAYERAERRQQEVRRKEEWARREVERLQEEFRHQEIHRKEMERREEEIRKERRQEEEARRDAERREEDSRRQEEARKETEHRREEAHRKEVTGKRRRKEVEHRQNDSEPEERHTLNGREQKLTISIPPTARLATAQKRVPFIYILFLIQLIYIIFLLDAA